MVNAKSGWTMLLLGVILAAAWVQPALGVDGGLEVIVDASPLVTTTYWWEIDKWADQSSITVEHGEEAPVNYSVTVDVCCLEDDYSVSGNIYIYNDGPETVTVEGVAAMIDPDIVAWVDCGVMFGFALDAGETLTCAYSADLPDDTTRAVTVEVTTGNSPAYGFGSVDFSLAAFEEVDECVDVVDTWQGYLGSACVEDDPVTFYYTRMIGGCVVCGYREVQNYAYFTTNDTDTTGCDSWTVCVFTPCEDGCTRTPGYWKTHSDYGPAPYDDTWAELPDGPDTPFFLSGQTYYEVLWTPKRGNAYYILAFQWIAAQLNVESGASIPDEVLAAWLEAKDLFETYTPEEIAALKGKSAASLSTARLRSRTTSRPRNGNDDLRQQFIYLAGILGDYNEGYVGPGHCSD